MIDGNIDEVFDEELSIDRDQIYSIDCTNPDHSNTIVTRSENTREEVCQLLDEQIDQVDEILADEKVLNECQLNSQNLSKYFKFPWIRSTITHFHMHC